MSEQRRRRRVKFTKVSRTPEAESLRFEVDTPNMSGILNGVRSIAVEGVLVGEVEVGRGLWIEAEPIDKTKNVRIITTSPAIATVEREKDARIRTRSGSVYELEFL